jgi:hypoxia up-regulated 1
MLEVEIGGVAEVFANLIERGAVDPVVKATLTLSDSGFFAVKDAVTYGEMKDENLDPRNARWVESCGGSKGYQLGA